MGAIRDCEVKQLFLNAKPQRLAFGGSKRHFLKWKTQLKLDSMKWKKGKGPENNYDL